MGWVLWEDVHPSELQNSLYLSMLTGLMAMQDLQMSGLINGCGVYGLLFAFANLINLSVLSWNEHLLSRPVDVLPDSKLMEWLIIYW